MEPTPLTPEQELQAQQLRAQGIPPELIRQILGMGEADPSALSKQYDQSAYVRRAATSPDYAKTGAGVIAQGLAGYMAGKANKDFSQAFKDYLKKGTQGKQAWWDEMYGDD